MATQSYFPEQKKPGEGGGTSGVVGGSGGSAVVGAGTGAAAAGPKKGSGFVNLDQYLSANRGNTNALADSLSGSLDKEVVGFNQGLNDIGTREAARLETGAGVTGAPKYDYSQKYFDMSGNAISEDQYRRTQEGMGRDFQGELERANQRVLQGRQNELNSANPFSPAGISGQAQAELLAAQGQSDRLGSRRDALQNDSSTQQQALTSQFNDKGSYNRGFAMLDSFLVNADQQANARAGGTNRLQAGLDTAIGKRQSVDASRTGLNNIAQGVADRKWQGLKNQAATTAAAPRTNFWADWDAEQARKGPSTPVVSAVSPQPSAPPPVVPVAASGSPVYAEKKEMQNPQAGYQARAEKTARKLFR